MTNTTTKPKYLNRFTTLPFVIDLLTRKKLALLNPSKWEDYNDRLTVERYKHLKEHKSIYALCLTDKRETIHHWNAFANGTSGCCVEFHYEKLIANLDKVEGVFYGNARYLKLTGLKDLEIDAKSLPFIKRHPFHLENEFRIISTSQEDQKETFDIEIEINTIKRITLSNKLPKPTFENVKQTLRSITSDYEGEIYHSTLFDNQVWAKYVNEKGC